MKKLYLISFFLILIVSFAFGGPENQEEIDYLLFLPNSGSQFVNEAQAMIQLDNLAKSLLGKELTQGQIIVYGYAAYAVNDIDSENLSRDRALFVISELQKRGVPQNLFSDPAGLGSVDIWGGNTNEEDRSPNRRVRVVLDSSIVTTETIKAAEPEIIISAKDEKEPVTHEAVTEKSASIFPWRLFLILLALIAALIYLLSRRRKSPAAKPAEPVKAEPVKAEPSAAAVIVSKKTVNLDEEIRRRAYELYLERGGQEGDAAGDWHKALTEVCAKYESTGYKTYFEGECWFALKISSFN